MSIRSPWGQVIVSPFGTSGGTSGNVNTGTNFNNSANPNLSQGTTTGFLDPSQSAAFPFNSQQQQSTVSPVPNVAQGSAQFNGVNGYVPQWYSSQKNATTGGSPLLNPLPGQTYNNVPNPALNTQINDLQVPAPPWLNNPFTDSRTGRNLTGIPEIDNPVQNIESAPAFLNTPFDKTDRPNYLDIAKSVPEAKEEINFATLIDAANRTKDMGDDTEAMKKFVEDALKKANG